jgi:CarD family transcriptional regulator, regulator of rRNA transcription
MSFAVGDKVVYPHHGATVIERVETIEVLGTMREYLVLRFDDADLTLRVPSEQAGTVGLREVIGEVEADDVFAVLRRRDVRMPSNWSRRFKNHTEMLKSGDVYQLAEVVRNLSQRQADKALSAGEKRMLDRARRVLISELTLALAADADHIGVLIDTALA